MSFLSNSPCSSLFSAIIKNGFISRTIIYYQADRFEHSSQKWKKRVLYRKRVQANIPVMQKHKNFPHSIDVRKSCFFVRKTFIMD